MLVSSRKLDISLRSLLDINSFYQNGLCASFHPFPISVFHVMQTSNLATFISFNSAFSLKLVSLALHDTV